MKTAPVKTRKPTIFRQALFWRLRLTVLAVGLTLISGFLATATDLRINSFSFTNLAWSCSTSFPFYHVEWAANLAGPWKPLVETDTTNSWYRLTNSSTSSVFLRVVATTNSWFYKGVAVAWTGNTNAGFRAAYTNGDAFVALTDANSNGNVTRITGAVWQPAGHPPSIFYAGTNGLPERAVVQDHVFLFSNYTSNKVDVAMIDVNNIITISRNLALLNNVAQLPVIVQGTAELTEAKALEASSVLLSWGGCALDVFESVATGGIAIPKAFVGCGNAGLDTYLLISGDDNPALAATSATLAGIDCNLGILTAWMDFGADAAISCGGAALSVAAAVKEEAAMQTLSKASFIQTASSLLASSTNSLRYANVTVQAANSTPTATGLYVTNGQHISISAPGTWNVGTGTTLITTANGISGSAVQNHYAPGCELGRLIVDIGGAKYCAGTSASFTSTSSGQIGLICNDRIDQPPPYFWNDNSGSITVEVSVSSP